MQPKVISEGYSLIGFYTNSLLTPCRQWCGSLLLMFSFPLIECPMLEHATFHSIPYFNGRTISRTSITPEAVQALECFRRAFALERPVFRMALRRTSQIPERRKKQLGMSSETIPAG